MHQLAIQQTALAKKLILRDMLPGKIKLVAGLDAAFVGKTTVGAAVVFDYRTMQLLETQTAVIMTDFPYIPGYLMWREGPALIAAYRKLKLKPDILLVNGNGILHPRFCGEASHIGLLLNKPTIGVAKSKLCGELHGNKVYINRRLVGHKFRNLYISPGHKISLRTAVTIVKACMRVHRLPEPLAVAHATAIAASRNYGSNTHVF